MKFDWELDTEIEPETFQSRPPYWRWLQFALLFIVLSGIAGGGWWRVRSAENELRRSVQDILDLEVAAIKLGDGEQFFTFFPDDPAYKFSQIQPVNREFYLGNPEITRAQLQDGVIWANATYQVNGVTRQRLLFFEQSSNGLRHQISDDQFWGEQNRTRYTWGQLFLFEADEEWRSQFAAAVQRNIDAHPSILINDRRNFSLVILDQFVPLAVGSSSFPSPRVWGLGADGEPSAAYWEAFDKAVAAQFALVHGNTIRFAIDMSDTASGYTAQDVRFRRNSFQLLAEKYMELNPTVAVEIVDLTTLPTDPVERMKVVDGAMMPLSADLITSGAILDLSRLAEDLELERGDFYEQIWQGGYWQDRLWQIPLSAQMRLIFYDVEMVESAEILPPWTFNDYENLIATVQVQSDKSGLLLSAPDLLYAYAFAHSNEPLDRTQAAAALQWFSQLEETRFLNALEPAVRRQQALTILSSNRQAATWIDVPGEYEYHSLLSRLGVAPFPSSDRLASVAPLWIEGGMISSSSENPIAVWRWLLYLSHQAPKLNRRVIPARPSVASETTFWQTVPQPLNDVMRHAFPTARAVTVEDRRYFSAESISANRSQPTPLNWFAP